MLYLVIMFKYSLKKKKGGNFHLNLSTNIAKSTFGGTKSIHIQVNYKERALFVKILAGQLSLWCIWLKEIELKLVKKDFIDFILLIRFPILEKSALSSKHLLMVIEQLENFKLLVWITPSIATSINVVIWMFTWI